MGINCNSRLRLTHVRAGWHLWNTDGGFISIRCTYYEWTCHFCLHLLSYKPEPYTRKEILFILQLHDASCAYSGAPCRLYSEIFRFRLDLLLRDKRKSVQKLQEQARRELMAGPAQTCCHAQSFVLLNSSAGEVCRQRPNWEGGWLLEHSVTSLKS